MAKNAIPKKYLTHSKVAKVEEPEVEYISTRRHPLMVADFTHKKFERIAAKVPFTQKDWANILHLSERTLQRYSQGSKSFEGIYVDRILQIEKLIDKGLETFADADAFYRWLKRDKKILGQMLSFESLSYSQGIYDLMDEIGRIQYGVYI
jgi:uncharacterized protein (DUF2384 family)